MLHSCTACPLGVPHIVSVWVSAGNVRVREAVKWNGAVSASSIRWGSLCVSAIDVRNVYIIGVV